MLFFLAGLAGLSRDLLDAAMRTRVLADPRITLRQNSTAVGLEGDADRAYSDALKQEAILAARVDQFLAVWS